MTFVRLAIEHNPIYDTEYSVNAVVMPRNVHGVADLGERWICSI